jgi:hypothetical protein
MPDKLNSFSNSSKGPTIHMQGRKPQLIFPAEAAAARAKSRFNTHRDRHHSLTYEKGGMHCHYLNIPRKDQQQVISDNENDAFDAVRNQHLILYGRLLINQY